LRPRRVLAVVGVVVLGLGGGWLWLRDSSLVGARDVTVLGLSGPGSEPVRTALSDAAHGMSTMHVDISRLRRAVASYTVVGDLRVATHFPHSMTITVVQRLPVATLAAGTLLRGIGVPERVPILRGSVFPSGERLSDPRLVRTLSVLAAAPGVLRSRLARAFTGPRGLTVALRSGPELYFGDVTRLGAKWAAAARVLADRGASGAVYVDLRLPERPAASVAGADPQATNGVVSALPGSDGAAAAAGPSASATPAMSTGAQALP